MAEDFKWIDETDDAGFEDGLASTFGYDDPLDNGIGAWGDNTNTPDAWGVSLPIETLREIFGDDDAAYGAVVELLNPATGQRIKAPIVDKGPAEWVIARQGPTIDVTEGVRRELGLSGMDPMQWRVLGHGVEPDGPAVAPASLPEGFQWLDNGVVPEGSTEVTTGQGDEDTIPLEPVSERPGGVAAPGQDGALPEGFRWVEEGKAAPLPEETGTPQEARAKRRQTLIDAIAKTEASGFPVDHTIGKPDEPEGDRAPTVDMENLVGALKQAEKAGWAQGNTQAAMAAAGERAYWENEIKTKGMTEKQEQAALESYGKGVPQQEIEEFKPVQQPQAPPEKLYDYPTGERAQEGEPYRYGTGTQPKTPPVLPEGQLDIIDNANMFARGASSEGLLAAAEGGYTILEANLPEFPGSETIRKNAAMGRKQVAAMRERVRKNLPVDRDAEEGIVGGVFQGVGQIFGTMPFYALSAAVGPILGTAGASLVVGAQLYDEARQDIKATEKRTGKKISEAEANKAALTYVGLAGPAEVLMDKVLIGRFLKGMAGKKLTVGQVIREGTLGFAREAPTETAQQAWLNYVAKDLSKYDPDRPYTQELAASFLIGGWVGLVAGGGGRVIAPQKKGFAMPAEQDEKLAKLRTALEAMKQQGPARAPQPAAPQAAPVVAQEAEEGDSYTGQPTSDEELDRMIEDYVNGTTKPSPQEGQKEMLVGGRTPGPQSSTVESRATAQGEWDKLSGTERGNRLRPHLARIKAQAQALGIEFDLRPSAIPGIVSYGDGTIKFRIGVEDLFLREFGTNMPSGAETSILLGEETVHAGDILGLKKLWDKSPEKALGVDFVDYTVNQGMGVFNDIADTIGKAPLREQASLYQALDDAFSLYYKSYSDERTENVPKGGPEVIDRIRNAVSRTGYKGPRMVANFVREFTRMARQQESQGIISEHTARKMIDTVVAWVKSALNRITGALPGVRQGKFGKAAQAELQRIDDTLKELGVSLPKVSAEEQAIAKGEGAPATAKPSLSARMREFFLPPPAAPKAPAFKEEMARLAPQDRLRAAIQVKGETFSADTHYAAMKAAIKKHGRMNVGDAVAGNVDYQGKFMPWERAEQRQETREGPATVNIGLATDDGKGITEAEVLRALRDAGVNVTSHRVEQSGTEPTVVAYLDQTLEPEEAFKLAVDLDQEAIAEQWMGGAELYGPQAEAWRPFNKEYFISQRQADPELMRGLDELEKIARDYEKFKTWYKEFDAFLDRVLLPENRVYKPLITDFIAATSPTENIKQNSLQAFRKLREFVETGTVTTQGGLGLAGKTKLPNLMRAIRGERLSGPKVEPFSQAMKLDPNAAAIDRHVAMILFGTRFPSDAQIRVGQKVAAQIAQRLGWEAAEVQAAWWAAGKELFGEHGKAVETYEQFLEEYREDLNAILTKDREGEGRGLQAVGGLPKGTRQGERLPGTRGPPRSAEPKEQVQEQRQGVGPSATQRPVVNRVINPKVARTINLEGTKKSWNWIKGPVIDLTRFWNGTRDVFARTPGLEWMGKAISKHVDLRAKYRGKYRDQMQKAWDTVPGTQRKKALEDFKSYWELNQEKGRAAADSLTISPHAKTLIDATKAMFNELGDINQSRNVHVFDPNIGAWRPIGKIGSSGAKDYFPRMIKNHIQEILRNPASNPAAWNELKDDMIAEGLIDPNNAEADMLKYVDSVMATYRANGFFGSLDRARSPYLPNRAYDYSFDTVRRYIDSWSERMAQIESFGQKLGKQGKDLFDKAYEMAGDDSTKRYIARVRDLAYNAHIDTAYGKVVASLNNIGTATQLAQFASTMKNFLSGMAFNYQNLGTGRFVSSFLNLHATFKEIQDGYERGVLQDDLMNIMNDGEQVTKAGMITGKLAGFGLKVTGFTAAETWVRGVSMVGARAMLRSATRAYNRNRRSGRTRQWLGYFQRLGIDGEALIIEGGKGDLFDAYMRRSVNEIQGGYTYADVPAFMDEPTGRFLLKYQKWGAEQLKHFVNGALKPFVRAATMRQAFKEKVTITNEKGPPEILSVPGAFLPMARYVLVLAAAGAGTEWLLENIFGRHAKTASIAEVMATWRRDQAEGFAKAMDKVFGYWLMAGAGGILGNYLQMGKDFTERTRFKNPAEPPGLDPVKQVVNAAIDLYDQKEITPKNVDEFLERTLGVYRTSKQMAARAQDVFGVTDFRPLEAMARRQDYSWIRSVTRRYDKEIGVRENVRFRGETGRSPESNFRDMLFEDLMLGDKKAAARRIDEHLKGMSDDRKKAALTSIKQSVGGRQPIKAGSGGGDREAGRQNFKRWAERNLSPGENARIDRIDATYRSTAQALDLMRADEIVPEIQLDKAMRRIKLMAE